MLCLKLFACALIASSILAGCSRSPQVAPANRRLIDGLRTATSSEQLPWVEESAQQIEEAKKQGTVTDEEYSALISIVALARDSKWKEAHAEAMRLAKAQKPTAEEVERLRGKRK